uniref:Uncharacterized protein n=1 Tax=Arundo donax TaxID=35708 RepID=A0A0A8YNR9_ARUDO
MISLDSSYLFACVSFRGSNVASAVLHPCSRLVARMGITRFSSLARCVILLWYFVIIC